MSRRAIKSINWAELTERLPSSQKNRFAAFKAKSDQYLRRMNEYPETAPQINWEYYRKNITIPSVVDKFKKEYESLTIPYPQDKYTALLDEQEKLVLAEIEEHRKDCEENIQMLNSVIAKLKAIMPYGQMTLEEFLEYHPECETGTVNKPSIWPHGPETRNLKNKIEKDLALAAKEVEDH